MCRWWMLWVVMGLTGCPKSGASPVAVRDRSLKQATQAVAHALLTDPDARPWQRWVIASAAAPHVPEWAAQVQLDRACRQADALACAAQRRRELSWGIEVRRCLLTQECQLQKTPPQDAAPDVNELVLPFFLVDAVSWLVDLDGRRHPSIPLDPAGMRFVGPAAGAGVVWVAFNGGGTWCADVEVSEGLTMGTPTFRRCEWPSGRLRVVDPQGKGLPGIWVVASNRAHAAPIELYTDHEGVAQVPLGPEGMADISVSGWTGDGRNAITGAGLQVTLEPASAPAAPWNPPRDLLAALQGTWWAGPHDAMTVQGTEWTRGRDRGSVEAVWRGGVLLGPIHVESDTLVWLDEERVAWIPARWGSVGLLSRTRPPERADRDEFIDDVLAWCLQASEPVRALCGAPVPHPPPSADKTVRLGLLFSTEDSELDDALLGILQFRGEAGRATGVSIGTTIPPFRQVDPFAAVRAHVLACIQTGCEDGFTVSQQVWARLQRGISTLGVLERDGAGHWRGRTSGGHGYPQIYDLAYVARGSGLWLVGVGSSAELGRVGILVDVEVRPAP
ncbi:MAG: hypothetical protein KTR31_06840 [Myxococcales bacterium]|nr:hypothetical protein [Myxococcales bacterium]